MPGITEETAHNLKWKSLKYMAMHDAGGKIRRHFFKHPLKYSIRYLKSLFQKKTYQRDQDFFLYGFDSVEEFEEAIGKENTL